MVAPSHINQTKAENSCVNNLRLIDMDKGAWGLENHKTTNDAPTMEDLRPWIGMGSTDRLPTCPDGGIYTSGRLGQPPTCSVGGPFHSLPGPPTPYP